MELSRKRIDDAPELDVHSSRFVTVTVTRVCASAWANVHHTLVSVWRDGDGFESSSRMLPSHLYCRGRFPSPCVTRFFDKLLEELR
jgi:hypothetical protein